MNRQCCEPGPAWRRLDHTPRPQATRMCHPRRRDSSETPPATQTHGHGRPSISYPTVILELAPASRKGQGAKVAIAITFEPGAELASLGEVAVGVGLLLLVDDPASAQSRRIEECG